MFCHICLASVFPFNNISDNLEYMNCIFNLGHSRTSSSNYIYIPSTCQCQLSLVSKKLGTDHDIDPDYNCNRQNCTDSLYYPDTEFNDFVAKNSISDVHFSILHINTRSFQNKIGKLVDLLNSIKIKSTVIAISETW